MSTYTGNWQGHTVFISLLPSRLSITIEQGGNVQVYNFDHEGRPWSMLIDEVTYQRGLNGKIVAKWIDPQTGRGRKWLSPQEGEVLERRCGQIVGDLRNAISSHEALFPDDLPERVIKLLHRVEIFTAERISGDIKQYLDIYKPIGILPPDQYLSIVLQATEGCSFNTCTFCNFYKDRPFRIKSSQEYREHAQAVRNFLGEGISLRRTIFLGDSNALVVPMNRLLTLMEITQEVFDVPRLGGIYAFLDGFSGERKSVPEYKALRERGLERVYIGLESGHEPLLHFLRKPGSARDALEAVHKIKSAGIAVGVIILLGAGGEQYARGHVRDSVRVLNAMQLDANDQIYFSELIEHEGQENQVDAFRDELRPLTPEARLNQGSLIEKALLFDQRTGMAQLSRYDIREFVY